MAVGGAIASRPALLAESVILNENVAGKTGAWLASR